MLKKAQLDHLREELMKQLDAAIDCQCNRIPQFQESGVRHGRFHISCSDEYSDQWLQTTVDSIKVPSEQDGKDDYQLKLVTSSEVPKLLRAEVFVSGPPLVYHDSVPG